MQPLRVLSLNHRSTPVEVRERVAVPAAALPETLAALADRPAVAEGLILSTCNRVELWTVLRAGEGDQGEEELRELLSERSGVPLATLDPCLVWHRDEEAVRHVFRVACSLDSMILGEPQILGQVKSAASVATSAGCVGTTLGKLLDHAFKAAKKVRTETRLGVAAVSISSAAVELAAKIFGELPTRQVLLIGAGEMAELAARHLQSAGCCAITVANRTLDRAEALAEEIGGRAVPLSALDEQLPLADIVISSTGAPETVLGAAQVSRAMRRRRQRSMLIIDIAVPRDVDIEVGKLDNVFLYDIDDLDKVVEANRAERAQEAIVAGRIVEGELAAFCAWQQSLGIVPTIVSLRSTVQAIQEEEVQRTLKRLGHLDDKDRQAVEAMARAIVNKILHAPLTELKRAGSAPAGGTDLAEAARRLFGLEEGADQPAGEPPSPQDPKPR